MKFFNFCVEQQNVTEWTESVIVNNFSSETVSDTTFRHVSCFSKRDNHRGLAIIGGKRINRGGGLGLESPVIYNLYSNPKYLTRLNELINSTETIKQPLRMEHKGLSSPKEPGRKKHKLKWRIEDDCSDSSSNWSENKHSGNLLKCILANDVQQTVLLHNYVTCHEKYSVSALLRVKTIKLSLWYR